MRELNINEVTKYVEDNIGVFHQKRIERLNSLKLKTVQPYFNEVKNGTKTFEIRRNDRDFQVGDKVHLQEYDMLHNSFSGEEVVTTITYVLTDRIGLDDSFCIFSFCKEESCPQCKSTYISKGDKDNDSQCILCDFIW